MEAQARPAALMGVEDIHKWARSMAAVPRSVADAFGGQCFLEDVDGPMLLSLTADALHTELGVEREYVAAVQAAIELLRRGGAVTAAPRTKSLREAFQDLQVVPSEGVPPPSPALALGSPAMARPPPSPYGATFRRSPSPTEAEPEPEWVSPDTTLSDAAESHVASLESDERAVLDASEGKAALERRLQAAERQGAGRHRPFLRSTRLHFPREWRLVLTECGNLCVVTTATVLRSQSAMREATIEAEHEMREADLEARLHEETSSREAAERLRDNMEMELAVSQALAEGALEQLAVEIRTGRETKAATKVQMIWRLHRVKEGVLTGPLNQRALLLEVEAARVAAAVVNAQIAQHSMQQQLAEQEERLASEARMREAMQRYASQRLAIEGRPTQSVLLSGNGDAARARIDGALMEMLAAERGGDGASRSQDRDGGSGSGSRPQMAAPAPKVNRARAISSPVTPVTESTEHEPGEQQKRPMVAMDEV